MTAAIYARKSTAETGIVGDLSHSFGTGNVAQRSGDTRDIVGRFRAPCVEIRSHFLGTAKLFSDIVGNRLGLYRFLCLAGQRS